MTIYNVLIIGAGGISSSLDEPNSNEILTHAKAFSRHPNFKLLGFVDTNLNKAIKAANKWSCEAYSSIDLAYNKNTIDIFVVATPDEYHYEILIEISKYKPKLVLAEKPLAQSSFQAEEISSLYKKNKIALAVNYRRRYLPEIQKLKSRICSGEFGLLQSGLGYYGKGLLHNGSHLLNLLSLFFDNIKAIDYLKEINDFTTNDSSVSGTFQVTNKETYFTLNTIDQRQFSIFEIDLLFEKARIKILDIANIIEIYKSKESIVYQGYNFLELRERIETKIDFALDYVVENIFNFLKNKEKICSTETDAMIAIKLCEELRKLKA